ncbi:MAG TPA: hypothetical protein VJP76_06045 [Candidatus Tumulicola sp.]|nr:hypothetical protein [Candidatus Tumulicola sp.]
MRSFAWGWLAFCLTAPLASPAQTPPATAAAALPSKPLRHLEYQFTVDYQRNGEGHYGGIGTGGSGVSPLIAGGGRRGKLDVDILAAAKDGGLVIRASEWLFEQPRPSQAYVCAVYPDTRVICPPELDVTDVENLVMSYLGRGFYDASVVDGAGRWQRNYSNKYVSVATGFTIEGARDANPLSISQTTQITSLTGAFMDWKEDAQLTYDANLEVLDTLHDVALEKARGASSIQTITDAHLVQDSFAKP